MVKLPDARSLGARDPRAVQRMPNYPDIPKNDPSAIALQNLGGALQGLGGTFMAKADEQRREQERLERFNQSNRLLQFEQQWDDHLQERLQTVEPGAAGFTAGLEKDFEPQARKFMQGVPLELKADLDQRLVRQKNSIMGRAQTFERNEARRYSVEQGVQSEDTLLERQRQNPDAWREIEAEGAGIWDNNTKIDNIERHQQKQRWEERRAKADLDQLRQTNPRAARDALLPQGAGSFVEKVVGVESGGDPNAKNPLSSATGAGQFISSTWRKFIAERHPEMLKAGVDVQGLRNDPNLSREAVAWYAQKNGAQLRAAGLPVNDATLYLAHFAGPAGATKILRADPGASAESVLGSTVVDANPFLKGMTAGQVGQWAQRKMGGKAGASADTSIDPRYAALNYEERIQQIKAADVAIERQKREYLVGIEDHVAHLRAGNTIPEEGRYSPADLLDNLGEEDAAKVHYELRKAEAFGADVKAVEWATPAEVDALVEDRRESLERPEEFRENVQNLQGLAQVVQQRNEQLVKDPARYVMQDEGVADAYAAMQSAEGDEQPIAAKAYANAALAMQERLGLPPEARRVLSSREADGIGRAYNDQVAGGQKPVEVVRSLRHQWGEAWPQVLGELSGHLPGPAMVMAVMDRPNQMRAAEQLAEAATTGHKALENMLPEETVKSIKEEVEAPHSMFRTGAGGVLQDFAQTLRYYPQKQASQHFATIKESVHLLALSYASQGDDPRAAVDRAAEDILGKTYNFSDSETFRVPVEHDIGTIERGADQSLASFDAAAVDLPFSLMGLPDVDTRAAYQSQIRNNGFWVTNEDETGLALFDEQGGAVTASGEPVWFTWEQLQESAPPSQFFRLVPGFLQMTP